MYYLIEQTLSPVTKAEYRKSRKARVAVLSRKEWEKEKKDLPFTEEIENEYLTWCKTDEGKQYLKGGSKYVEKEGADV